MTKSLVRCLVAALTLASWQSVLADQCVELPAIINRAVEIRGLPGTGSVACQAVSREEFGQIVKKIIDRDLPAERLTLEESILKRIGFIPESYDYKNCLVAGLATETQALFSSADNKIFVPSWYAAPPEVLFHEAIHALQHASFNLTKIAKDRSIFSDEHLSTAALIEGDAMLAEQQYLAKYPSMDPGFNGSLSEQRVGLDRVAVASACDLPESLLNLFRFQYDFGLVFATVLYQRGGWSGIDQAFKQLPKTTREIIHYGSYPAKDKVAVSISVPSGWSRRKALQEALLYQESLGQYVLRTLFSVKPLDRRAISAAAGWRGDRLALFQDKDQGTQVLTWAIKWATEKDLLEAYQAFLQHLAKQYHIPLGDLERYSSGKATLDRTLQVRANGKLRRVSLKLQKLWLLLTVRELP